MKLLESLQRAESFLIEANAKPPVLKDGEFALPMLTKRRNRKLNTKTNRMKNFKRTQYCITKVAPEDRTMKNIPRYATGNTKVYFVNWLGVKKEKDGYYGKGNDGKYYGWSHRAVYGFGKGDNVTGDNLGKKCTYGKYTQKDINNYRLKNPKASAIPALGSTNFDKAQYENDFVIKDDEHAKQVAKMFANNVG